MMLWTEYQNLVVGSIGFAGVIFTLWFTVAEHGISLDGGRWVSDPSTHIICTSLNTVSSWAANAASGSIPHIRPEFRRHELQHHRRHPT